MLVREEPFWQRALWIGSDLYDETLPIVSRERAPFAILFLTWGYVSAFLAAAAAYFVRDAYGRVVREMTGPHPTLGPTP